MECLKGSLEQHIKIVLPPPRAPEQRYHPRLQHYNFEGSIKTSQIPPNQIRSLVLTLCQESIRTYYETYPELLELNKQNLDRLIDPQDHFFYCCLFSLIHFPPAPEIQSTLQEALNEKRPVIAPDIKDLKCTFNKGKLQITITTSERLNTKLDLAAPPQEIAALRLPQVKHKSVRSERISKPSRFDTLFQEVAKSLQAGSSTTPLELYIEYFSEALKKARKALEAKSLQGIKRPATPTSKRPFFAHTYTQGSQTPPPPKINVTGDNRRPQRSPSAPDSTAYKSNTGEAKKGGTRRTTRAITRPQNTWSSLCNAFINCCRHPFTGRHEEHKDPDDNTYYRQLN